MKHLDYKKLDTFIEDILTKANLDEYSKMAVKTGLIESSVRGVDSHGVRLLPHYIKSTQTGRKNPRPNFKLDNKFKALMTLDADNGFGHAAGFFAIDKAMEVANEFGICAIGVHNSSHPGAMASFALRASRKGFLCFAFTHADSLMLSHNGTKPYFGTNPICFSAPREDMEPYCLDMATTKIPWNRVLLSRAAGTNLPDDLIADANGNSVNDPNTATCLLPIGDHKGYGLASMVEILCALFNGIPFGLAVPSMYKSSMESGRNLGQFYIVMRADAGVSLDQFKKNLTAMTNEVHDTPKRGNEMVILPGDKEINIAKERMEKGIPVDQTTFDAFYNLSQEFKVSFPW